MFYRYNHTPEGIDVENLNLPKTSKMWYSYTQVGKSILNNREPKECSHTLHQDKNIGLLFHCLAETNYFGQYLSQANT